MKQTRTLFLISLLAAGLLVAASQSRATLVAAVSPKQIAARAGIVFAGTVTAKRAEWASGSIITRIVFKDLRLAKGRVAADSLVLSLAGGQVGREIEVVDGQPNFEEGRRYVVFATSDLGSPANHFMPVVGLHQGYFRVHTATGSGRGTIQDSQGLPVVAIEPEQVTVLIPDSLIPPDALGQIAAHRRLESLKAQRPSHPEPKRIRRVLYGSEDDPGVRVTEQQFLGVIRGFLR